MIFIGGVDAKQSEIGEFDSVHCPHCQQNHPMSLYKSYYFFHFFFLPLFKWSTKYIITCHGCHSLMGLSSEKGKALERGRTHDVDPADLTMVAPGRTKPVPCPNCRGDVDADFQFCPHCGERVSP